MCRTSDLTKALVPASPLDDDSLDICDKLSCPVEENHAIRFLMMHGTVHNAVAASPEDEMLSSAAD